MKKLILTILIALLAFSLVSFAACEKNGGQSSSAPSTSSSSPKPADSSSAKPVDSSSGKPSDSSAEPELKEIEGVIFNDASYTYTGEKYSILASNIPEGVTASYVGNENRYFESFGRRLQI